ncbi:MAG: shikimate dehydrogenase, partial [Candidatus Hodarchaeales archaeon]
MKPNPKICAVIGYPIKHSLSPAIHNAAYSKLDLNYNFKAIKIQDPSDAIDEMIENDYRGYSVTIPLKTAIMKHLDRIQPIAMKIGAVNTVVNDNGKLKGYNTDVSGALRSLNEVLHIPKIKVVIIGAGGAARAIAFGLKQEGTEILIQNRTVEKAKTLAHDLGCDFSGLNPESMKGYDLIINTTPVGMYPKINRSIISEVPKGCTVHDIVYNPLETKFLKLAKKKD